MDDVPQILEDLCLPQRGVSPETLEQVLTLAVQIAREGREGRKIGTIFVVGDSEAVMKLSRPLILDPLLGHPDDIKHVMHPNMRETIKELAQLDGGFVVSDQGVVLSAARYISASSEGIEVPLGLGTRHLAGASITRRTDAVAVVVSESSVVRLFDDGKMICEILPELWMLRRYGLSPRDPSTVKKTEAGITVVSKKEEIEA